MPKVKASVSSQQPKLVLDPPVGQAWQISPVHYLQENLLSPYTLYVMQTVDKADVPNLPHAPGSFSNITKV